MRTHGTMTTPRSISSLSTTTPTVTIATTMVTPRLILAAPILPDPFRRAALLLHHETTAAIRDIVVVATDKDVSSDIPSVTTPTINGRETITRAL